jgi:hypothetical protein
MRIPTAIVGKFANARPVCRRSPFKQADARLMCHDGRAVRSVRQWRIEQYSP